MGDSSSEDEVFFGPITQKEKKIAARYHGRKTLILPQRNPLYRRWSTTHIPSAIGDDKVTLESSSSNLPDPSQGMPQDDCSPTPVLPFDGLDNSPPLSCAGGEVNVSSVLTHSTENSFETGHEDLSPLTNSSCYSNMGDLADDERSASTIKLDSVSSSPSHSNISCYSNIGNLADDERSASTIKLDSVSAPASHSKDHSRPLEATTQLQRPSVVTPTLPQDPVLEKHTPHACHSPNPILLEKSNQESSFSSPKILQYDQSPNSSAIPTSGTFASVTLVKSFSECPGELCDSLQELSVVKCEEHNCSLKESQSDSMEPATSPSTPKYTVTDLQCVPAVPDYRQPGDNEPSSRPMKPDNSDSITSPMKPDNSDSITSPMKPGDSDSITSPMKPDNSDSITSPMKPDNSDSITSPMKPDNSDSITSPMKPGDSEAPDILPTPASRVPDMGHCCLPPSRPRECVGNLRVSGNDLTKSPGILQLPDSSGGARELNASSSSFPASPSFNDTLEEINQFLKYGVEYGERGAMIPSNGTPQRHLNSRDPAECSPGKVACSPQDLNCASDESDNSPIYPERKPTDNSHREPSNCLVNPSPSPQHPDSGLREHCALPASPRFNDTLEEIEQFLKYGVDYEDTSASGAGSQGFINSSAGSSSCSSSFQPPLESTRASGAVTPVVNDEEKKPSLQQEQHSTATVSVKKTPLASPLHAKTLHATAAQSLPAATTKPGLARPVQRVTPTSRAQVCLPHSQPVKASVGSAMKASHIPKVMKSQPHTPTTSKLQPTASRVKLQLGSCVATPTPKAAGLPPHPQRRLAPRLLPKKPQAPTSDVRHQRAQWHKIVASPLAKELRNNPPPPLVVNIKSTSSQSPWHPPSTSCQQSYQPPTSSCNLFPNGGKVQRAAEGTPSPKVCHDVQDSRVLPVVNYKTGMSVVLNKKDNKENTRRQCCKPPTPVTEVKVIKHTGRMMVAKPRNTSQGGERTSLMEVSVHQPVYMD